MREPVNCEGFRRWHEAEKAQAPQADMQILTSDGHRVAAHSAVLASASSVLESLVYAPRKGRDSEKFISILGVPSDVVFAFLYFVYSSRSALSSAEGKEAMKKYGVQLLVLAHKFRIGWLKRGCEAEVARHLRPESAVDVLQIARLCDSSRLYQRCLSLAAEDFPAVLKSGGWRFVHKNDRKVELEFLKFVQETDQRKARWRKEREEQEMYRQLSEAMDFLEHICMEGCTSVGPHDSMPPPHHSGGCGIHSPCTKSPTCEGLQLLIHHFAKCSKRLALGCSHCKRMWQLFRLHSSLCRRGDACKVPLCRQFRMRKVVDGKGDEATWRLLVKKVVVARAMCSLARRKRPEQQLDGRHLSARGRK